MHTKEHDMFQKVVIFQEIVQIILWQILGKKTNEKE